MPNTRLPPVQNAPGLRSKHRQVPPAKTPRVRVRRSTRTSRREKQPKTKKARQISSEDSDSEPIATPGVSKRYSLPADRSPSCSDASLDLVLKRLDDISLESKRARDEMAEAKADRDALRKTIREMGSITGSDLEEESARGKARTSRGTKRCRRSTCESRDREPSRPPTKLTQDELVRSSRPLQQLRQDNWSAGIANEALRRTGLTTDEASTRKLKSGYHMTINDQVHVQAQWPQLNVYRATKNLATYETLTVGEFCTGYTRYVIDNLNC